MTKIDYVKKKNLLKRSIIVFLGVIIAILAITNIIRIVNNIETRERAAEEASLQMERLHGRNWFGDLEHGPFGGGWWNTYNPNRIEINNLWFEIEMNDFNVTPPMLIHVIIRVYEREIGGNTILLIDDTLVMSLGA